MTLRATNQSTTPLTHALLFCVSHAGPWWIPYFERMKPLTAYSPRAERVALTLGAMRDTPEGAVRIEVGGGVPGEG